MPSKPETIHTAWDASWVHDPDGTIPRSSSGRCHITASTLPEGKAVMLDTSFYIHRLQQKVPLETLQLADARDVLHSGVALAELTITAGLLDPAHPATKAHRSPVETLLRTIPLAETKAPSPAAWAEAGMLAGILARTQLGLAKPKKTLTPAELCCQQGRRRKLLNDALIFLTARENDAVLISSNRHDMELMLRFRPDGVVYTYQP